VKYKAGFTFNKEDTLVNKVEDILEKYHDANLSSDAARARIATEIVFMGLTCQHEASTPKTNIDTASELLWGDGYLDIDKP
jgi:hypothetical protein